jgi:hypothetical protein
MSTLGAELTAVVQGGVEIRLPCSANLTVAPGDRDVLTVELKVNLLSTRCGRGLRG